MLALVAAAVAVCEIAPISFADAVRAADRIVVAEVVGVREFPAADDDPEEWPLLVAELRVERFLKGSDTGRAPLVLASATWQCDVTSAELGERGVYFLAAPSRYARGREPWARTFARELPGELVERIVGSGQGKFLERRHEGRPWFEGTWIDLRLEFGIARDPWRGRVEPESFESLLLATIEKQRRPLLTAELLTGPAEERWTAELARDRSAKLSFHGQTAPIGLRLESLWALENVLGAAPPPPGSFVLSSDADATVRLVLHARDGDRELLLCFSCGAAEPDGAGLHVAEIWRALSPPLAAAWPDDALGRAVPRSPQQRRSR